MNEEATTDFTILWIILGIWLGLGLIRVIISMFDGTKRTHYLYNPFDFFMELLWCDIFSDGDIDLFD